ncbi:uncharacterized protein TNCT_547211 [Trichonephila clavata]|uniref:Uncharacterized protein n=1 Tax=Trichonephila clavata TaxID=2740835 RepID=A0A8X6FF66_TRICU|nr:uncharacterized protein TNCT_547211 [Trichonephila clavata]
MLLRAECDPTSQGTMTLRPERNRPKPSRIPVYAKRHWESGPAKECIRIPCECGKDSIPNPSNRAWRMEGHAIYCPKATIAYRCYLNNKLESLFRIISKRQYCGNIIDSSSHARWMRMAGIYQDEDASYFKKFAKNRMVLPISEYKSALQKMCEECNMDYWEVLRRMTNVEIGTSGRSPKLEFAVLSADMHLICYSILLRHFIL